MNQGTLALLIHGGTDNWSPERWKTRFDAVCADRPVFLLPDENLDPAEVRYAAVWKPRAGELAAFPNLRVIFNLGAGVDALIADASLPKLPIVRVAVDDLTKRMTEYVVLHVLAHHRQEIYLRESQREKRWAPKYQWPAGAISVGIMGLGNLGADAAEALKILGFKVSGWSRLAKNIPGVSCFHGTDGLAPFLKSTNILVCLLAADRRDAAHPQPQPVCAAGSRQPARRAGADQCRPRRTAGRGGTAGVPERRHAWRRDAGRIRDRAAAEGQPVLDPSKGAADAAQRGGYRPRRDIEICGAQIERFEAGQALENVVDLKRGY